MRAVHYTESAWVQYALIGGATLLVLSPALARAPKDDYPLSTYPMFSENKSRETRQTQALAIGPSGETVLGPKALGTDEVMQSRSMLDRAARAGKKRIDEVCTTIAANVAKDPALSAAERVEIRAVVFDSFEYLAAPGEAAPKSSKRLGTCKVVR